ncbi:MAG: hypothetical protein JNN07_10775 [Verrucomicrobiales bacterium]|nr:hypothetical protein [Verrucomicrobiales bacterium]
MERRCQPISWGGSLSPLLILLLCGYCSMGLQGRTVLESFETDPITRGWVRVGDLSLFEWESETGSLLATWDSSRSNSYFALPLGGTLTRQDDFRVSLDLTPLSIVAGSDPEMPGPFEMAFGFLNLAEASSEGFIRGNGTDSPNLVEWDYFPDTGFGATIASALVATNGHFESAFTIDLELQPQALYRIDLIYTAALQSVRILMTRDGVSVGPIKELLMSPQFGDFRVDAFALSSYSGVGQDPNYPGSIYAQARVDNIVIELPDPFLFAIQGEVKDGLWTVSFPGRAHWAFQLERSADLIRWQPIGSLVDGSDELQSLSDPRPDAVGGFYRVLGVPLPASVSPP